MWAWKCLVMCGRSMRHAARGYRRQQNRSRGRNVSTVMKTAAVMRRMMMRRRRRNNTQYVRCVLTLKYHYGCSHVLYFSNSASGVVGCGLQWMSGLYLFHTNSSYWSPRTLVGPCFKLLVTADNASQLKQTKPKRINGSCSHFSLVWRFLFVIKF